MDQSPTTGESAFSSFLAPLCCIDLYSEVFVCRQSCDSEKTAATARLATHVRCVFACTCMCIHSICIYIYVCVYML